MPKKQKSNAKKSTKGKKKKVVKKEKNIEEEIKKDEASQEEAVQESKEEMPEQGESVDQEKSEQQKKGKDFFPKITINTKTILIIEDDTYLLKAHQDKLESEGFSVILATQGADGLKKMGGEKPDILLLDLVIPFKDGFEVLADIRADESLSSIPVVVLTNITKEIEIERVKELGAAACLIKADTSLKEIVVKIKLVLSEHDSEEENKSGDHQD